MDHTLTRSALAATPTSDCTHMIRNCLPLLSRKQPPYLCSIPPDVFKNSIFSVTLSCLKKNKYILYYFSSIISSVWCHTYRYYIPGWFCFAPRLFPARVTLGQGRPGPVCSSSLTHFNHLERQPEKKERLKGYSHFI